MITSYTNEGAIVKSGEPPAPPEAPEIVLIAYQVIRKPHCEIKIPISINGVAVKFHCEDPQLVRDAFERFVQGRCDEDPKVREFVTGILAKVRAEEEVAKQ